MCCVTELSIKVDNDLFLIRSFDVSSNLSWLSLEELNLVV
jgi:hypothetical protein